MLKPLRGHLTLLYLLAAAGLVTTMGLGAYFLIQNYFEATTDLALRYKMAQEFRLLRLPLPEELSRAEKEWQQNNTHVFNLAPLFSLPTPTDETPGSQDVETMSEAEEHLYDAELAAVFVAAMDENGAPIVVPNQPVPPVVRDNTIFSHAHQAGYDLRTMEIPSRGRMRILTYATGAKVPAFLQTGRLVSDQARALSQYMLSLTMLGSALVIVLAMLSWWLAGRSLGPAQQAWDQQQVFVSNASHELRTPLTLIRASADYGLRSQSLEERAGMLQDIIHECDYVDRLVDDLLLLSRLDAHRLKLSAEPVALSDLCAEIARQTAGLAEKAGVTLQLEGLNTQVRADRVRLRQVLLIFLDNALRFTPAGGSIRISARTQGKLIQVEVADSGRGIDPKHIPHLFERFYQVASPENEAGRSNGLGLSIARALIEAQGGSIRILSQPGRGTRVQFTVPSASR